MLRSPTIAESAKKGTFGAETGGNNEPEASRHYNKNQTNNEIKEQQSNSTTTAAASILDRSLLERPADGATLNSSGAVDLMAISTSVDNERGGGQRSRPAGGNDKNHNNWNNKDPHERNVSEDKPNDSGKSNFYRSDQRTLYDSSRYRIKSRLPNTSYSYTRNIFSNPNTTESRWQHRKREFQNTDYASKLYDYKIRNRIDLTKNKKSLDKNCDVKKSSNKRIDSNNKSRSKTTPDNNSSTAGKRYNDKAPERKSSNTYHKSSRNSRRTSSKSYKYNHIKEHTRNSSPPTHSHTRFSSRNTVNSSYKRTSNSKLNSKATPKSNTKGSKEPSTSSGSGTLDEQPTTSRNTAGSRKTSIKADQTHPKTSVIPVSKLIKNELLDINVKLSSHANQSKCKEVQPSSAGKPNQIYKPNLLQRHRNISTCSNSSSAAENLVDKVVNMDKRGIKNIINTSGTIYDDALKAHARRRLREEIRKQLKTMNLEQPRDSAKNVDFVTDEIVDAIHIPALVLNEISKAFGIELLDSHEETKNTDRNRNKLSASAKCMPDVLQDIGSNALSPAHVKSNGVRPMSTVVQPVPTAARRSSTDLRNRINAAVQLRARRKRSPAKEQQERTVRFVEETSHISSKKPKTQEPKRAQKRPLQSGTSAHHTRQTKVAKPNDKSPPENVIVIKSSCSSASSSSSSSSSSSGEDSESDSNTSRKSNSSSVNRRLQRKKSVSVNIINSFETLILPLLSDSQNSRYKEKFSFSNKIKLLYISCICTSEYNSSKFSENEIAKLQRNLNAEDNATALAFLMREIVNVFNKQILLYKLKKENEAVQKSLQEEDRNREASRKEHQQHQKHQKQQYQQQQQQNQQQHQQLQHRQQQHQPASNKTSELMKSHNKQQSTESNKIVNKSNTIPAAATAVTEMTTRTSVEAATKAAAIKSKSAQTAEKPDAARKALHITLKKELTDRRRNEITTTTTTNARHQSVNERASIKEGVTADATAENVADKTKISREVIGNLKQKTDEIIAADKQNLIKEVGARENKDTVKSDVLKEESVENKRKPMAKNKRETVTDNERETVVDNERETVTDKGRGAVADKERDCSADNELDAVADTERETAVDKKREAVVDKELEAAADKERNPAPDNEREAEVDNERETVSSTEREVVVDKKRETVADTKRQAVTDNEGQAVVDKELEAAADKERDLAPDNEREAEVDNERETVASTEREVAVDKKRESVAITKRHAVTDDEGQAVVDKELEAAADNERDTAPDNEREAEVENERETVASTEREVVVDKKRETVADTKRQVVTDNEGQAVVDKELEAAADKERNPAPDNEREAEVDNERETVSSTEREVAVDKKRETVAITKRHAVTDDEGQAVVDKELEAAADNERDTAPDNEREAEVENERETVASTEREVVVDKKRETVADTKRQVVTDNEGQAVVDKELEAAADKERDPAPDNEREAEVDNERETVSSTEREVVVDKKRETVAITKRHAVTDNEGQAVVDKELEAAVDNERDTAPYNKRESEVDNERETVASTEREVVVDKKRETVADTKRQAVTDNEGQAVVDKELEAAEVENERETMASTEREAEVDNERETVASTEREVVVDKKRETVAFTEREVVVDKKRETVADTKRQAVTDNEGQAVVDKELEAADENERYPAPYTERKAVASTEREVLVDKKRKTVADNERQAMRDNEVEAVVDEELEAVADKWRDPAPDNEREVVANTEREAAVDNKGETLADNEREAVAHSNADGYLVSRSQQNHGKSPIEKNYVDETHTGINSSTPSPPRADPPLFTDNHLASSGLSNVSWCRNQENVSTTSSTFYSLDNVTGLVSIANLSAALSNIAQHPNGLLPIDQDTLRQDRAVGEAVVANLREIDAKLLELHKRKMFIEELILKLQKDKMEADLQTMRLQNEKFMLLNTAMTANATVAVSAVSTTGSASPSTTTSPANVVEKPSSSTQSPATENETLSKDQVTIIETPDVCKKRKREPSKAKAVRNCKKLCQQAGPATTELKGAKSTRNDTIEKKNAGKISKQKPKEAEEKPRYTRRTRSSTADATSSTARSSTNVATTSTPKDTAASIVRSPSNDNATRSSRTDANCASQDVSQSTSCPTAHVLLGHDEDQHSASYDYSDVPVCQFNGIKSAVTKICVFEDSIIASSEDGNLYKFNIHTLQLEKKFAKHREAITQIYLCTQKNMLYTTSLDGYLKKSSIENFDLDIQTVYLEEPLQSIDVKWGVAYIGSRWGNIFMYDVIKNRLSDSLLCSSDASIIALKATKEGPRKILIVSSKGNLIYFRDANSGLILRSLDIPDNVHIFSFLLDFNCLYCGTQKNEIYKYDFTTGKRQAIMNCGNGAVSMKLYKRKFLFVGCYDGFVYVLDKETGCQIGRFPGSGKMVIALEIAGDKIITSAKDKSMRIMDIPKYIVAKTKTETMYIHRSKEDPKLSKKS